MKTLITGASGFLGQHLTAHLNTTRPNDEIHSLGVEMPKTGRIVHHPCDMTQRSEVNDALRRLQPDRIYHLAGTARVSPEIGMPQYFQSNFQTTTSLAYALENLKKPVAVFLASSVHVYGNHKETVDETVAPHPISPYAYSKYLAELAMVDLASRRTDLRIVIGRLYSCIGPGQPEGFVTSDLARRLARLREGEKLKTGPLTPIRRFLDVRDAVALFPKLLDTHELRSGEIVNVASLEEVTIRQMLEKLLDVSGKRPPIESEAGEGPVFTGLRLKLDKLSRAVPELAFRPLEQSLRDIWQAAQ